MRAEREKLLCCVKTYDNGAGCKDYRKRRTMYANQKKYILYIISCWKVETILSAGEQTIWTRFPISAEEAKM